MNTHSSQVATIQAYASRGVLIDTNLLLMYLVGLYDRDYVPGFKRTQQYTVEDFDIVHKFVRPFHLLVTTPHVLSELSNLSKALKDQRAATYFVTLVEVLKRATEVHIEKDRLLADQRLPRFGFTDLSLLEAARELKCLVLTDDFAACGMLQTEKCAAINFNHLRQMSWSG